MKDRDIFFLKDIIRAISLVEEFVNDLNFMAKMRDKIAHFYFGIDYEIVWDVIKNKLPSVKILIEKVIK